MLPPSAYGGQLYVPGCGQLAPPPRPAAEAPLGISAIAATSAKQAITDLGNMALHPPFPDSIDCIRKIIPSRLIAPASLRPPSGPASASHHSKGPRAEGPLLQLEG